MDLEPSIELRDKKRESAQKSKSYKNHVKTQLFTGTTLTLSPSTSHSHAKSK